MTTHHNPEEPPPAPHAPRRSFLAFLGLRGARREGENVRFVIVLLLFAVLILTVVWSFLSANGPHWNNVKDLLDLLFPAETALLGTAIAFYMSAQGPSSAQQDRPPNDQGGSSSVP